MTPQRSDAQEELGRHTTNSKPVPHIPLPFKEVIADVLKVKPPEKVVNPSRKTKKAK
jgi:hypothetical protein